MTSSEENVTTTPESKAIGAQPVQPSPDGFHPRTGGRIAILVAAAAFAALALLIYSGIHSRAAAESRLKQRTEEAAIPTVAVVFPKEGAPTQEIVLPGNTQAFSDAPIYARTSGYLKRWYFDIGAHVQKDQLLAQIETPEVDQQLQQARADLHTAQANLNIAKITAARWQDLVSTGSVSQQETDQAVSNLNAVTAAAESSAANVRRLEQLQAFEKVYAPFDGIITARNTDIGALIDAGASTQPRELFHIAAIRKLRLYVAVPEVYSRAARSGAPATLTLDEFPGQTFHGILVRDGKADLVAVKIGRDYGNSVEIVSGLQPTDAVIVDPSDSLVAGMEVRLSNKPAGGPGR